MDVRRKGSLGSFATVSVGPLTVVRYIDDFSRPSSPRKERKNKKTGGAERESRTEKTLLSTVKSCFGYGTSMTGKKSYVERTDDQPAAVRP
jgi:hypothetical protein